MRRHPYLIFGLVALVLAFGSALGGPAPDARTAAERKADRIAQRNTDRQWRDRPQPSRPQGNRVLTRNPAGGRAEAKAAERPAARESAEAATVALVTTFAGKLFLVAVMAGTGALIWWALWAPVLARRRRY